MKNLDKDSLFKTIVLSVVAILLMLLIFVSSAKAQQKETFMSYLQNEHKAEFYDEQDEWKNSYTK